MKAISVCVLSFILASCVVGTKKDAIDMARAFFEAGFNCARRDMNQTKEDCWNKYKDILE